MTSGQPTTLLLAAHSLFHGALGMLQTHQAEPRQRWGSGDPPTQQVQETSHARVDTSFVTTGEPYSQSCRPFGV